MAARYRWLLVGALAMLVGIVAAVLWWPDSSLEVEEYRDFDICLLTTEAGLDDPQVAAAWAGAQEVSAVRRVRVSYQPVSGEQTTARAVEYLSSLVAQECEVIVAVGPLPVVAVTAYRDPHPESTIVAAGREIDDSSDANLKSSTVDLLLEVVPAE